MFDLEQVCRLTGARRVELTGWIEESWVLPAREGEGWLFSDTDVARVRLIVELRRELRIDAETLPVVLSLMDRVYALRRCLRTLGEAIQDLPEPARRMVEERLSGERHGS